MNLGCMLIEKLTKYGEPRLYINRETDLIMKKYLNLTKSVDCENFVKVRWHMAEMYTSWSLCGPSMVNLCWMVMEKLTVKITKICHCHHRKTNTYVSPLVTFVAEEMSLYLDTLSCSWANHSLLFLLSMECLAQKKQIKIIYSLVWPNQDLNSWSTVLTMGMLTITRLKIFANASKWKPNNVQKTRNRWWQKSHIFLYILMSIKFDINLYKYFKILTTLLFIVKVASSLVNPTTSWTFVDDIRQIDCRAPCAVGITAAIAPRYASLQLDGMDCAALYFTWKIWEYLARTLAENENIDYLFIHVIFIKIL